MKAAIGRFLWLWLAPLLIFLTGLTRAWLTGQADPWDWALPMAVVLAVAGGMMAQRGWRTLGGVATGGVGMALIFCMVAAGRAPDGLAVAGLLAVALLAVFGGARARHFPFASSAVGKPTGNASPPYSKRKAVGSGLILLMLSGLLLWRGPARPVQPVPDRPDLAVITGLPLFWDEMGQSGPRDAPIVTMLRTRFTVIPMDDPLSLASSRVKRLLLAQPRALSPAQLVAIDRWVQDGGTALVLADPLLRWPSDLPPGDRRRAPSASLLHPLLTHWGFRPFGLNRGELRHAARDGHLLTLSGVRAYGDDWGVRQRRVGKGIVWLLGDADPIDDRLWLADPSRPLDPRLWVADTPARLVHWLGGAPIPGDRRWMRAAQDVRVALRWAVLAGTIWAILGAIMLRRAGQGFGAGTKGEDGKEKGNKSG